MRLFILVFCVVFCSSCATIRFTESQPTADTVYHEKIHHITLMKLYEYSEPVSPKKICKGRELSYIETEYSLVTWAINYIPGIMSQSFNASAVYFKSPWLSSLGMLLSFVPMVYSPMSVKVACQALS